MQCLNSQQQARLQASKAFSARNAISGDSAALPFSRFVSVTQRTRRVRAAPATLSPSSPNVIRHLPETEMLHYPGKQAALRSQGVYGFQGRAGNQQAFRFIPDESCFFASRRPALRLPVSRNGKPASDGFCCTSMKLQKGQVINRRPAEFPRRVAAHMSSPNASACPASMAASQRSTPASPHRPPLDPQSVRQQSLPWPAAAAAIPISREGCTGAAIRNSLWPASRKAGSRGPP